jgi:hypothetical protein
MRIRLATEDDARGLARIQVDSYRTAYAAILPADYLAQFSYEEQEQDWRTLLATKPETVLLVAVPRGNPFGLPTRTTSTVGSRRSRAGLSRGDKFSSSRNRTFMVRQRHSPASEA